MFDLFSLMQWEKLFMMLKAAFIESDTVQQRSVNIIKDRLLIKCCAK